MILVLPTASAAPDGAACVVQSSDAPYQLGTTYVVGQVRALFI